MFSGFPSSSVVSVEKASKLQLDAKKKIRTTANVRKNIFGISQKLVDYLEYCKCSKNVCFCVKDLILNKDNKLLWLLVMHYAMPASKPEFEFWVMNGARNISISI